MGQDDLRADAGESWDLSAKSDSDSCTDQPGEDDHTLRSPTVLLGSSRVSQTLRLRAAGLWRAQGGSRPEQS